MAKSISNNFCESKFPPLTNTYGSISSDPFSKADTFAKIFSSNSTLADSGSTPESYPQLPYTIPDIKFTTRVVRQTLQNLDTKKATGPDDIPPSSCVSAPLNWLLSLVNSSACLTHSMTILPLGNMLMSVLFRRQVKNLTHSIIDPLPSPRFFLRQWKPS